MMMLLNLILIAVAAYLLIHAFRSVRQAKIDEERRSSESSASSSGLGATTAQTQNNSDSVASSTERASTGSASSAATTTAAESEVAGNESATSAASSTPSPGGTPTGSARAPHLGAAGTSSGSVAAGAAASAAAAVGIGSVVAENRDTAESHQTDNTATGIPSAANEVSVKSATDAAASSTTDESDSTGPEHRSGESDTPSTTVQGVSNSESADATTSAADHDDTLSYTSGLAVSSIDALDGDDTISDVSEMMKILNMRESDSSRLDISTEEFDALRRGQDVEVEMDRVEEVATKLKKMLG